MVKIWHRVKPQGQTPSLTPMSEPALRCVVVVCGDPEPSVGAVEGCFATWFVKALGPEVGVRVVDPRAAPLSAEVFDGHDAVILTGSPHSVYDPLPWVGPLEARLREAVVARGLPTLGVCFGHQLLAQALGGRVVRNPRGREMGTIEVRRHPAGEGAPLFAGLGARFTAQATHCDTVIAPPEGAAVLAESDLDACQTFRWGSAWGVQFHPEVTAPILKGYVRARSTQLRREGTDPEALYARVVPAPAGQQVLDNFVRWARAQRPR